MNNFEEIYKRILFTTNAQTQTDLATILDISQSSISDAKRRRSIPSDWLVKLYDKFGVNPDWLRFKKEPMYMRMLLDSSNASMFLEEPTQSMSFRMPIYNTFCTKKRNVIQYSTIDEDSFPKNIQPKTDLVFYHNSDNMEPVLPRASLIGVQKYNVDEMNLPIISGDLYALFVEAEGIVFRRIIQNVEHNDFLLCFENNKYPASQIDFESLKTKLIGKISWVMHNL